jgi:hypothetical protein
MDHQKKKKWERKSLISHDSMTDKFVFGVNEFYFIKEVPLGFVFPSSYKKQKKNRSKLRMKICWLGFVFWINLFAFYVDIFVIDSLMVFFR